MKEQVKRIVEGHKAIRGLSPDRDFLVGMIEKMQAKIEELEKDAVRYYISRMPIAFMHYPPKKPELVRLDFYPIAKKQEINNGWVSVPLYVDEAMKG